MKPKPGAKASKPLTESKIWLLVLLVIAILLCLGLVSDASSGWDLYPMALRRASAAFGVMLVWGGYHFYSRRQTDLQLLVPLAPCMTTTSHLGSISAAFIMSLGTAALILSIVAFVPRWAELRVAKPAPPSQSDHPLYDADIDGAAGRLAFEPRRD